MKLDPWSRLFSLWLCASVMAVAGSGPSSSDKADKPGCRCPSDDELQEPSCLPGQFYCVSPAIDPTSQSAVGCGKERLVRAPCFAAPNVTCCDSQCVFEQEVPCRYVRGRRYNYYVAVALSLFLGMFGIDRFYLGYPALGLAKLCTLGFLFVGQLVDFLLILLQAVGPADRSDYFIPFYGPLLREVNTTDPFLPVTDQMCA